MHLHAQRRPRGARQGRGHIPERDATPQRRGRGRERVRNLVDPVQRELDVGGAPRRRQPEPRPQLGVEHDALRPHLCVPLHRIPQDRTRADRDHARHARIVEIQHGDTGGRECGHQLALGPGDAFEIPEVLHVGLGDARHDADVRKADLGQARHVADAAGAHLQDHPLDIVRCIQEGERESQLVVERPLARRHPEGRGEALPQQVLGRRLAHRARDADHTAIHVLAREQTQLHECDGRVSHDDRGRADGLPGGEVGRGSSFEGDGDELVPVALGNDRNIEPARRRRAGVDGRSVHHDVGPDQRPTEADGEFRSGESHASPSQSIV